jgi:hypothetical protein
MAKTPRPNTRFVYMREAGITKEQLFDWFSNEDIIYKAVYGAYRIGHTYFVLPSFSLSDEQ